MKKLSFMALVIIMSFAITSHVSADAIGIKAGLNFSNITDLEADAIPGIDMGTKSGLVLGLFYRFDLSDHFALQPEILYSMKGAKDSGNIGGQDWEWKIELNYIEIPVLFKYKIPTSGKIAPNLYLGPYLAFKTKASSKMEAAGQSDEEDLEGIKGTDFGLTFGGGFDFKIGSGSFLVDARYSFGLSKIDDEGISDSKNGCFTVMLGYAFN